jgi:hypothetical protein
MTWDYQRSSEVSLSTIVMSSYWNLKVNRAFSPVTDMCFSKYSADFSAIIFGFVLWSK